MPTILLPSRPLPGCMEEGFMATSLRTGSPSFTPFPPALPLPPPSTRRRPFASSPSPSSPSSTSWTSVQRLTSAPSQPAALPAGRVAASMTSCTSRPHDRQSAIASTPTTSPISTLSRPNSQPASRTPRSPVASPRSLYLHLSVQLEVDSDRGRNFDRLPIEQIWLLSASADRLPCRLRQKPITLNDRHTIHPSAL